MITDVAKDIAVAQAKGSRQMLYVQELLTGKPVHARIGHIPGLPHMKQLLCGKCLLPYSSARGLFKRLRRVGFVVEYDKEGLTMTLKMREEYA